MISKKVGTICHPNLIAMMENCIICQNKSRFVAMTVAHKLTNARPKSTQFLINPTQSLHWSINTIITETLSDMILSFCPFVFYYFVLCKKKEGLFCS